MTDPVLEIKDLTVCFGAAKAASGVSFSVRPGEVMALVGESGSGKTVTALSVLDLVPGAGKVKSGEILLNGKNILVLDAEEMRNIRGKNIAMVFQEPFTALNPVLKIGEQILETIIAHRIASAKDAPVRIKKLLSTVKLSDQVLESYPHELSGGMRQRAMLAMALSCDPQVLILDEPTTALDVSIQKHILDLIRSIQREKNLAVLFITHDFSVVNEIADGVCVMKKGLVIECGKREDVLRSPGHEYTKKLIGSIPKLGDKRKRLPV